MALEVCVKAAVGAPDALGDCNFPSLSLALFFLYQIMISDDLQM